MGIADTLISLKQRFADYGRGKVMKINRLAVALTAMNFVLLIFVLAQSRALRKKVRDSCCSTIRRSRVYMFSPNGAAG